MESKVLIAFLLSFLVLVFWSVFFPPPKPTTLPQPPAQTETFQTSGGEKGDVSVSSTFLTGDEVGNLFSIKQEGVSQKATLEQEKLRIELTNQLGGGISRVYLKNYFETIQRDKPYQLFKMNETGPLFRLYDSFSHCFDKSPQLLIKNKQAASLIYNCPSNQSVKVTYQLHDAYMLDISLSFSDPKTFLGNELMILFPANVGQRKRSSYNIEEFVYELSGSVERTKLPGNKSTTVSQVDQAVSWVAFGDRYFFVGAIPPSFFKPRLSFKAVNKENASQLIMMRHILPASLEKDPKIQVFMGPKDKRRLEALGTLSKVVDFGFFKVLAVPIYGFLKLIHTYVVSNFGLAIIILTILIRLLFLPLTLKGMGSMQAMQKIQPQMKKLREKHKDNREKLNQEMVALLKTNRVNPLGGCLPIMIQIPVFIALYAVLINSVDLYHAPFFGWLQDLSSKDPFYILPVLLGVSFLLQQKLTPSAADPTTQKMMMFMPIMFTVFMLNLPSGLTLYIFTSTLLGIFQQVFINKRIRGREAT